MFIIDRGPRSSEQTLCRDSDSGAAFLACKPWTTRVLLHRLGRHDSRLTGRWWPRIVLSCFMQAAKGCRDLRGTLVNQEPGAIRMNGFGADITGKVAGSPQVSQPPAMFLGVLAAGCQ